MPKIKLRRYLCSRSNGGNSFTQDLPGNVYFLLHTTRIGIQAALRKSFLKCSHISKG